MARTAAGLTGLQYATRGVISSALRRLPDGRRPAFATEANAASLRLQARNAWRGETGPGLAELAADWNAQHDTARRAVVDSLTARVPWELLAIPALLVARALPETGAGLYLRLCRRHRVSADPGLARRARARLPERLRARSSGA